MVLAPTDRDDDALTLQLAGDGRVSTLRTLLRQLDDASVEVEALTVHTPDLDDVFFGLTGKKGA
jgi:ABC-2 type transport system ATP-binding protein